MDIGATPMMQDAAPDPDGWRRDGSVARRSGAINLAGGAVGFCAALRAANAKRMP